MRTISKLTCATALVAGTMILAAAPSAFAGNDDGGSKAFFMPGPGEQYGAPESATQSARTTQNERYRAQYDRNVIEPQTAPAVQPEKVSPYFYHSMGTMSAQ